MLRFQIAHAPAGEPAEIGRRGRQAKSHVYRQDESARASAPEQGTRESLARQTPARHHESEYTPGNKQHRGLLKKGGGGGRKTRSEEAPRREDFAVLQAPGTHEQDGCQKDERIGLVLKAQMPEFWRECDEQQGGRGKHPVFAGLQQKLPEQEKRERVDKDSKDLKRDRAVDSRQLGQLDKSNLNRIPEQVMWIQVLGAEKVESLQAVDIPVIIEKRRTQRQVDNSGER